MMVKIIARENGRHLLTTFLKNKRVSSEINLAVDVDALDLL